MSIQKFQLEKYKMFPYIAWTVIILFAIFVWNLVSELQTTIDQIDQQITATSSQTPDDL